jgi:hypothetical protein
MQLSRYHRYIFRNAEPEFGWDAKEKALTASKHLREHLKRKLPRHQDDQSDTVRSTFIVEYVY